MREATQADIDAVRRMMGYPAGAGEGGRAVGGAVTVGTTLGTISGARRTGRYWDIESDTSAGYYYRVEERTKVRGNLQNGSSETYLFCPCPSWTRPTAYGSANCKHAERVRNNWLAHPVKLCMVEHPFAGYGPCTKEVGPDGRHLGHHGNDRYGWPQ